jgi:hypothetical protein
MPERACEVLWQELNASKHKLSSFRRETPTAIANAERQPVEIHSVELHSVELMPALAS